MGGEVSYMHEYKEVESVELFQTHSILSPPCRTDICIARALLWVSRANISGQMTHVTKEHMLKIGCITIELEMIVRKE